MEKRPVGRPRKSDQERRDHKIGVALTLADHEWLTEASGKFGVSRSELLRLMVLQYRIWQQTGNWHPNPMEDR